jgi:hypothetical protein
MCPNPYGDSPAKRPAYYPWNSGREPALSATESALLSISYWLSSHFSPGIRCEEHYGCCCRVWSFISTRCCCSAPSCFDSSLCWIRLLLQIGPDAESQGEVQHVSRSIDLRLEEQRAAHKEPSCRSRIGPGLNTRTFRGRLRRTLWFVMSAWLESMRDSVHPSM